MWKLVNYLLHGFKPIEYRHIYIKEYKSDRLLYTLISVLLCKLDSFVNKIYNLLSIFKYSWPLFDTQVLNYYPDSLSIYELIVCNQDQSCVIHFLLKSSLLNFVQIVF